MHDEINQLISQFIDDELSREDSLRLLRILKDRPEVEEKMRRFELTRAVMTRKKAVLADADFVKKISQQIAQEPSFLIPKKSSFNNLLISSALAVAASVAIVTVLVLRDVSNGSENGRQSMVVADAGRQSTQPQEVEEVPLMQPVDARFNEYLQAHRGSLYIAEPTIHPYARLAGYGQP